MDDEGATTSAARPIASLRLASPRGTRRGSEWQAFEAREATVPVDDFTGEPFSPAPCHLVPSGEEVAHALVDVSIDATESRPTRAIGEVVRPAEQRSVQRVAHFWPRVVVAGDQQVADLRLEPLHALLGRACAQIPFAVRLITMRAERVAEEVEAFLSGISQRSFSLVECRGASTTAVACSG